MSANLLPVRHKIIVHLIRHASSDRRSALDDPGLSAAGLDSCMKFNLEEHSLTEIKNIISSPMLRALDTAVELFKNTLLKNPGAVKVQVWPELQSYRAGGFQEAKTLDRLRKYGMERLDITRLVKGPSLVDSNGKMLTTSERAKLFKKWLLGKREGVTDKPYEIAVVSHACVFGCFPLRDRWSGLTWITCVFNDKGVLERMPNDEFKELKISLLEKGFAKTQRMEEIQARMTETIRTDVLIQQEQDKARADARIRGYNMDMTRRRLQQYDALMKNSPSVSWRAADAQDNHRHDSQAPYFRSLEHSAVLRSARRPRQQQPAGNLLDYTQESTEKIKVGSSMEDNPYQGKSFLFMGFRHEFFSGTDFPPRLILNHVVDRGWRPPFLPDIPRVMFAYVCTTSLGIYELETQQLVLDLRPLFEPFTPGVFFMPGPNRHGADASKLKQIQQEIPMLRETLPANEISATEEAEGYPLLPLMVKIRFPGEEGWYRGYLPGPEGMEFEAHLCKVPQDEDPAPKFEPRPEPGPQLPLPNRIPKRLRSDDDEPPKYEDIPSQVSRPSTATPRRPPLRAPSAGVRSVSTWLGFTPGTNFSDDAPSFG